VFGAVGPDDRRHPDGHVVCREVARMRMVSKRSCRRERVDPLDPEEVMLVGRGARNARKNLIGSSLAVWSSAQVVSRLPSDLGALARAVLGTATAVATSATPQAFRGGCGCSASS
jgi:hypothetical protein